MSEHPCCPETRRKKEAPFLAVRASVAVDTHGDAHATTDARDNDGLLPVHVRILPSRSLSRSLSGLTFRRNA